MDKTKEFLDKNKASFEEYDYFTDYDVLFEAIADKKTPDNCIEACKSLLEGIAKTIIWQVDIKSSETKLRFESRDWDNVELALKKISSNTAEFHFLFPIAVTVLAAHHHSCEKEFILGIGNKFCKTISHIRNHKGDIAHGRVAPKLNKSSLVLANIVEGITDTIALHILEVFSLIDFVRYRQVSDNQLIIESFMLKTEFELIEISEREMLIREFNDYLDELYPIEGKPIYSLALYEQYSEDYEIQLQEFIDNREQEAVE